MDPRYSRNSGGIFSSLDKRVVFVFALLLEAAIFWHDYVASPLISFELYYFAPIAITAWYVGRIPAYVLAALSSLTRAHLYATMFAKDGQWLYAYDFLLDSLLFFLVAYLILQFTRLVSKLTNESHTDHLTGVNNRRHFFEAGAAEVSRSFRYKYPLTLVYIDIDNFKRINDSHGHSRGDQLLADLAKAMREGLRASDVLGRIGGDEFAIVLPHTNLPQAELFVQRMREELEAVVAPFNPRVTLSVGVVVYSADKSLTLDDLISKADKSMYSIKHATKDAASFAMA
jgi:diguanylate cyclase (GGDEF)-like protein